MRRLMRLSPLAALLLIVVVGRGLASPAFGQDDHGEPASGEVESQGDGATHKPKEEVGAIPKLKQGLITGVTAIVVFGIVMAILGVTVWPKIVNGLDERAAKIEQEIASAEAAREQAKDALDEYEQNLSSARAESQKMLEQAKVEQAKLAVELRAKTDLEIGELRGKAMRDIEAARRSAVSEIYAEAASLATSVAGKILEREISTSDQQRLVSETLGELGRGVGDGVKA